MEAELRKQVDATLEIESNKLKQTFSRYKNEMEKAIIQAEISRFAWKNSKMTAQRQDVACDMDCVNYCFSDESNRFENIQSVYQVCLVA